MKQLNFAARGDGSHCGLSDWYPENEAALEAALDAHEPFDTGWYASKKEIATARIYSEDGIKIKVEVSVSDDFDTEGAGYASTLVWHQGNVAAAVCEAWKKAEQDQEANAPYEGFSVGRDGKWEETFLWSDGTYDSPPGDNYWWWGWQHHEEGDPDMEGEGGTGWGAPDPEIPLPVVAAFERWVEKWVYGEAEGNEFRIGRWTIRPWREAPRTFDDPSDYVGMGWVGADGRP